MIARSLKSNILLNLVVLLSIGTFLLAVVAVITHHRDVLRSEIAKISLIIAALDENMSRVPQPDEAVIAAGTGLGSSDGDFANSNLSSNVNDLV